MDNIIYIGERSRALQLLEGLLREGFDMQFRTHGEAATVATIRTEDMAPAVKHIGRILDGLYTGVQK